MHLPDAPERAATSFLKLKDKESVQVVFRGEPHFFFKKWENGKSKVVSEGTEGASWSFRMNAITKENGVYVAKILEGGITMYNQLKDINEEYPLETTAVKISRSGTGTDTTYSILPLVKTQVNLTAFETVKLNELAYKPKEDVEWGDL